MASTVKTSAAVSLGRIEDYLRTKTADLRSTRPGVWRLSVDGVMVLFVAEEDRVRFLAPIFALNQLESEPNVRNALMLRLLQSNFERSHDARYSVFDGIVFATLTHPRRTLQEADLDRFLMQIVNLHKNTFRNGDAGYSASAPLPDSVEIDPRVDDSLRADDPVADPTPPPSSLPERPRQRIFL